MGMAFVVFISLYVLRDYRGEIGRWKMAAAEKFHNQHDIDQALAAASEAQHWDPDNIQFTRKRVDWLQKHEDLPAALEAVDDLLESVQGNSAQTSAVLIMRADLLQSMKRHKEALADSDEAFKLQGVGRTPSDNKPYSPSAVNTRAYFIARARAAGQASDEQVGQALVEMQELIRFWDVNLDSVSSSSPTSMFEFRVAEIMFLDTYAYLRLYAGDHQRALFDLNRCVEMTDHLAALAESESAELGQSPMMQEYVSQLPDHKAVIVAHRGAAHRMLGNTAAANADFQTAAELGFNPRRGLW